MPWYDPNKALSKQLEAALAKAHPGINLNTNHIYTFEALLIAADAYKRAGSADPKALADAIRATNITNSVSIGPGIQFDAKGQNATPEERGHPEPRRQARHGGAQGGRQRQGRVADDAPTTSAAEARQRLRPLRPPRGRSVARQDRSVPAEIYLNVAVSGLLTGLVYGLMALGLSVIFGVVRVVNFAHGEMMTIAMYLAVALFSDLPPRSARR